MSFRFFTFVLLALRLSAAPGGVAATVEILDEVCPAAVSASSVFSPAQDPMNLISGAGLDDGIHDAHAGASTMWHSALQPVPSAPAPGLREAPAWVRFDFAEPVLLRQLGVWNHNQAGMTDRGFRATRVYGGSEDGSWSLLSTCELAQGGDEPQPLPLSLEQPVRSVVLAAGSNWGGTVFGLSEVKFYVAGKVEAGSLPMPSAIVCEPQPWYRHRPDGNPGRELRLRFQGAPLLAAAQVRVQCGGKIETFAVSTGPGGVGSTRVLLPPGASVHDACTADFTLEYAGRKLSATAQIPAKRQWTVYLYPHSHVDIGYTNPQEVVEQIHMRNLDVGLELGRATADYPEGARHVWNNEVGWAVEGWLRNASPERKREFVEAVRKGWIGLSASYCNANTSAASDEELLRFFSYARELRRLTGAPVDTMCQFDIPGMSWGTVPAAAQNGVRAILDFPNGADRTGLVHVWRNRPFYWVGPDGKSKVLYIQLFPYNLAWKLGAHRMSPKPYADVPGRDRIHFADTPHFDRHSEIGRFADFLASQTAALEGREDYPCDIIAFAWSLSDNSPVDAGLPGMVKSWNERHAFPKLVIASASTIASAYETRLGGRIPELRGDLTEYWTDGLGSDARRVGSNRIAKELLVQAETLWAMTRRGEPFPAADFHAAWRWIQLGTEHTWGFMFPDAPIARKIEAVKASYFDNALRDARARLDEAVKPMEKHPGGMISVFNTLPWSRTGVVGIQTSVLTGTLRDKAGKALPVQKSADGDLVHFLARDVPALGAADYTIDPSGPPGPVAPSDLQATPTTLENAIVQVTLDPATGDIAGLVDKRSGHDFARKNGPYALNSFRYLRGGDAPAKATQPTGVKISVHENGPVMASLRVESKAEGCNKLTREIRLVAGQPQVEIINTVDKVATRNKEGVHFAFAFNLPDGATPRMDIPWGVMNPRTDQLEGANKNWLACQRWVDLSADDRGVTWVPVEASVFQFGDITANLLGSVSPGSWSRQLGDTRTIVSWALNNHWHTNFPLAQGGVISFSYAILPHGAYDPVVANRFALERTRALLALPSGAPQARPAPVVIDNPRVFLSTLKPSDDGRGTILRLRSLSGNPESVRLGFPGNDRPPVRMTDAREVPGDQAPEVLLLPPYGTQSLFLPVSQHTKECPP